MHTDNVDTWYTPTIENVMAVDFTGWTPCYMKTECWVV